MYVVTANVRYRPNGLLVPSFLWFDAKEDDFDWYDEGAEFFPNYQDAWALADDIIKGRKYVGNYPEVRDIEVKEIKIFDIS